MLLGAKHAGRPRIVAHHRRGVLRFLSVPNVFSSNVLSFRSIYRIHLQIFGRMTNVLSIVRVLISRVVASLRERGNRAAAYAVRYLHVWRRTAYSQAAQCARRPALTERHRKKTRATLNVWRGAVSISATDQCSFVWYSNRTADRKSNDKKVSHLLEIQNIICKSSMKLID